MGVFSHDCFPLIKRLRLGRARWCKHLVRPLLLAGTAFWMPYSARNMQAENDTLNAISPAQVRAGRALLDWSRDQLVEASGVPKRTLVRLEQSETTPHSRTLAAIRTALEAAGVEFIEQNGGGPGVRLK
jgi:hypothetical protein